MIKQLETRNRPTLRAVAAAAAIAIVAVAAIGAAAAQESTTAGEMMTILGFDRRSGEYTLIGLDTSGTYWVAARGPANESGDGAVLSGEDYDAVFEHMQLYDFVLAWPDDDTFRIQIIFKDEIHTGGGPPFKMVETVSRRRR